MNREIKFRGISVNSEEFVYGYLATDSKIYDPKTKTTYEIYPETVGQFTGIYDRKQPLFEGDILTNKINKKCIVWWFEMGTEFLAVWLPDYLEIVEHKRNIPVGVEKLKGFGSGQPYDIIGNIHQDKDLTKQNICKN